MVLLEGNIFTGSKKWDVGRQKGELCQEREYHQSFISKLICFQKYFGWERVKNTSVRSQLGKEYIC